MGGVYLCLTLIGLQTAGADVRLLSIRLLYLQTFVNEVHRKQVVGPPLSEDDK